MSSFMEVVMHEFGKLMVRGLGSWHLVTVVGSWPRFVALVRGLW